MSPTASAPLHLIASCAALAPVPWANGAGSTVELISYAEAARLTPGRPAWRLSIASLDAPAPFSAMPEAVRTFRPIGADVVLRIDGTRLRVADASPCVFAGAADTELIALPAPCRAVNLMTARSDPDGPGSQPGPDDSGSQPGPDGSFVLTLAASAHGPAFTLLRAGATAAGASGTPAAAAPATASATVPDSLHGSHLDTGTGLLAGVPILRF